MFRLRDTTWVPSALDAVAAKDEVKLTAGSAYGGCGAKLSKGLLEKVLCGLPRLESEDVLVGIEYADDAGVIRVSPDIAIIHTTDFFPPMVDDPYSFGRIAAVNALSDVWAMGGTVLAGMNLVSYPLSKLGREALTEILRGGLSALEEAAACSQAATRWRDRNCCTAWPSPAPSTPIASGATPARSQATCWCSPNRSAPASSRPRPRPRWSTRTTSRPPCGGWRLSTGRRRMPSKMRRHTL